MPNLIGYTQDNDYLSRYSDVILMSVSSHAHDKQQITPNKRHNIFMIHLVMYYCCIYSVSISGTEYNFVFDHLNCVGQMYEAVWIQ